MRKIPSNALAVATIKGKNLTELMSLTEFNNSFIGKELLAKQAGKSDHPLTAIEDAGFNFGSSFYYFNQSNDSVTYNCFLAPVKNVAQVDALYKNANQKFNVKGDMRSYYNADSTEVAQWNGEMFFFVLASGKKEYFSQPDVRERLGLKDLMDRSLDIAVDTATAVSVDSTYTENIEAAVEAVTEPPVKVERKTVKKAKESKSKSVSYGAKKKKPYKKVAQEKVKEEAIVVPVDAEVVADSAVAIVTDGYGDTAGRHTTVYSEDDRKKNALIAKWTEKMVTDFMENKDNRSILDNKDFVKSIDAQAEATIWISGVDKLFNTYMPSTYLKGLSFFNGYGSGNARLYLEDKTIRMASSMTFSNEIASVLKRVHKRKLNKRFLKYVNEDHMIGYLGYALDTKTYLEEYPKLMSKIYGSIFAEEIGMAADLFTLLLDEAAIGKVVKGDALFIFNGLSQNEVSYKSYEYNEDNFESKEVMKTKKETLPDFLLMISSEDTRLIDKLIAYGVKKELVKKGAGYYELSIPKSPLALYFTIKDNIMFFGTSKSEMDNIAANRYVAHVSAKHRKTLMSSNYAAYFSAKKLAGKIPSEELGGTEKLEKTNRVLNALGDIYLKSNPIKGNVLSGQVSMDIPANQPNALKYLFSIVEDAQK
ncbi:MAG: hypothetical protein WC623_23705 [Pedobacter sp.]|uniref:hypothetical protein n=1 Tax=Pedobacter sp. TaxID=1411316 RepID=UPI0035698E35